ncbi:unnamed protein product [Owenia fusiformis]|uniref:Peptidase S1 domain-containing protein n=1 Tax=Owenia fusiformis TaxID=6347 RepID=A0A8S4N6A7_OWEFU|nr:unnamed protein product [Owenia fusiformis]
MGHKIDPCGAPAVDRSANIRRKFDGEWTEADNCTVCKCESHNNTLCDESKCGNKCGEFSQYSPCPLNSCGKRIQMRKCSNSKNDMVSQRNSELNMANCSPPSPAQCPQPGVAITNAGSIIIGGIEVSPKFNYRWMVYFAKNNETKCGGSILSPIHILSAAHCFGFSERSKFDLADVEVKTGKHDTTKYEGPLEQRRTIKNVKIHEHFDMFSSMDNDIAIVTLASPLQFNYHTHPIILPKNTLEKAIKKTTRKGICKIIGWGNTIGTRTPSYSDVLLEVAINLERTCSSGLGGVVTDNMFCASAINPNKTIGANRLDSCFGDSGGPLMCREGVKWYQYGIVSWGPVNSCGNASGVYTKVPKYVDWITGVISTPGGWGNFSEYSPCSVSCGGGIKSRVRACTNPVPIANGTCSGYNFKTTDGEMVHIEDEECNTNPCA